MKELEALLQWAANQGIILNGVKPIHIQGRGAGVIATRRVEVRHEQVAFDRGARTDAMHRPVKSFFLCQPA